jgi:hypothetical protein
VSNTSAGRRDAELVKKTIQGRTKFTLINSIKAKIGEKTANGHELIKNFTLSLSEHIRYKIVPAPGVIKKYGANPGILKKIF